jgi:hypothetical protein
MYGAGEVVEARRLLAEATREQPRWRDAAKALARDPSLPALDEILAE